MFIKEVDKVFLKSEYSMRLREKKRSAVRKKMKKRAKKKDKNKRQNLKALKGEKNSMIGGLRL